MHGTDSPRTLPRTKPSGGYRNEPPPGCGCTPPPAASKMTVWKSSCSPLRRRTNRTGKRSSCRAKPCGRRASWIRGTSLRADQIEVFVRSRLAPEERIDTPAPVERRLDSARPKDGKQLENAFGGHSSLGAARRIAARQRAPLTGDGSPLRPDEGRPACDASRG